MDRPTSTTITNSGIQSMTKPGLVKSSRPESHPCWKTRVRIPKAAPHGEQVEQLENKRHRDAAESDTPIISRVSSSTTPMDQGQSASSCWVTKSSDSAAPPPTAYSCGPRQCVECCRGQFATGAARSPGRPLGRTRGYGIASRSTDVVASADTCTGGHGRCRRDSGAHGRHPPRAFGRASATRPCSPSGRPARRRWRSPPSDRELPPWVIRV